MSRDRDWSLLTDPETGEVVTLTPLQTQAIWRAMRVWAEVCAQADSEYIREPGYTTYWINMEKSRLLGRMLLDGKPPHPTAPPNAYAAGWWEVVENGIAFLNEHEFGGPYDDGDGGRRMGICSDTWEHLHTEADGSYIVGHRRLPGEKWRLSKCTEQSERTRVGTTVAFGDPEAVYATAVLERITP